VSDVAILGAGSIGATLTRRLTAAGRSVTVGVLDPTKPATVDLAAETGASAVTSTAAVESADLVVLAVPGPAVPDLMAAVGPALDGRLVVDATNAVGGPGPVNGHQHVAAAAPAARYARAFNSLGWENFADPVVGGVQADLLWCGPDGDDGATVERLIADVGLRPVRVGGLDQLAVVDGLLSLWFALALGQGLGRHLAFKVLTG
jgi:predicted dinucleotide-binding enzyme